MKDRRELSAWEASGALFDGSIWPVHGPCARADDEWLDWNEEVREAGRAAIAESVAAVRRTVRSILAAAAAALRERLRARTDLLGTAAFLGVVLFIFHRLWTAVAGEGGEASWARHPPQRPVARATPPGDAAPGAPTGVDGRGPEGADGRARAPRGRSRRR